MKAYYETTLESPLGEIKALADEKALILLEFQDCERLYLKMVQQIQKTGAQLQQKESLLLRLLKKELQLFFAGKSRQFSVPLAHLVGTPFQKQVWQELLHIPFGKTCSYAELAAASKRPLAFRAAANANALNPISIIVPCHRVIRSGGALGGYGGGIWRKKWLINHEKS